MLAKDQKHEIRPEVASYQPTCELNRDVSRLQEASPALTPEVVAKDGARHVTFGTKNVPSKPSCFINRSGRCPSARQMSADARWANGATLNNQS